MVPPTQKLVQANTVAGRDTTKAVNMTEMFCSEMTKIYTMKRGN